jgi:serine/threonine protein kinase
MTIAQMKAEMSPSGEARCSRCLAVLPSQAQFCASCGARMESIKYLVDDSNIVARYRKTSLLHRRPYVNLFFAVDAQLQRQVALRDIDISSLSDEDRAAAYTALQREYDLLRQRKIAALMPAIDMGYFQGHLFTVASWPSASKFGAEEIKLHTLQDVLQYRKGLPPVYVALSWIEQICRTLVDLHQQGIVIGDLDPHTMLFNSNDYVETLALMISWLPAPLYALFPHLSSMHGPSHFAAPEVLLGHPEPRSDIYSVGAILYLLLTGTPPEEPAQRIQHRLRSPSELDAHINSSLDDFILQALALDRSNRFESASAMLEALARLQSNTRMAPPRKKPCGKTPTTVETCREEVLVKDQHVQQSIENENGGNTLAAAAEQAEKEDVQEPVANASPTVGREQLPPPPAREFAEKPVESPAPPFAEEDDWEQPPMSGLSPTPSGASGVEHNRSESYEAQEAQAPTASFIATFKQRVTGILPAIPRSLRPRSGISGTSGVPAEQPVSRALVPVKPDTGFGKPMSGFSGVLKGIQQAILGEQRRETTAAAVIETPLRVQPAQTFAIRIQLPGRCKQQGSIPQKKVEGGISALGEGDVVHIEVRSVLYQNYAYVVQQANVTLPADGYAAEVTIPMQPLSNGPSGRRERLHVFFMDEKREPLYEKPFVLEIFISHLVQPGREGHNVLTIPL